MQFSLTLISRTWIWWLLGFGSVILMLGISCCLGGDVGEQLTRNTIRLSMLWYAIALGVLITINDQAWRSWRTNNVKPSNVWRIQVARWCWTWAAVCFLVHVASAFHFYHHWSHVDAFTRTQQISGNGEGIYVSYLFTLVWCVDVGWWWLYSNSYAERNGWIGWMLHAAMLFIVFNGMVVFASGPIRWIGIVMFSLLLLGWQKFRGTRKRAIA